MATKGAGSASFFARRSRQRLAVVVVGLVTVAVAVASVMLTPAERRDSVAVAPDAEARRQVMNQRGSTSTAIRTAARAVTPGAEAGTAVKVHEPAAPATESRFGKAGFDVPATPTPVRPARDAERLETVRRDSGPPAVPSTYSPELAAQAEAESALTEAVEADELAQAETE